MQHLGAVVVILGVLSSAGVLGQAVGGTPEWATSPSGPSWSDGGINQLSPPPSPPPAPPAVPLSGGVALLALAGGAYGMRRLRTSEG